MKRFLTLAVARIPEVIRVKDKLVDMTIEPVYENGKQFSGQVLLSGTITDDVDEKVMRVIMLDYLRAHAQFARIVKVEFRALPTPEVPAWKRTA